MDFFNSLLERDDFSSSRHPALPLCLSMIFSKNRQPLFGIMLYPFTQSPHFGSGSADVPQGMIGTLEVEFFGLPSIGRSE